MSGKSIVKQVLQPRRVSLHSTIKRRRIALAWATVPGGALLIPTALYGPYAEGCAVFDFDSDSDVDLEDYREFTFVLDQW